jgi:RNA polymerase primary sigma factor
MAPRHNVTPSLHHYLRRLRRPADRTADRANPPADRLAGEHLGLVVTIARRYWFDQIDLDDLVQAGNLGLLRATRSFDPSHGGRLATWIAFAVRQSVLDHLAAHQHPIPLPRAVHQRYSGSGHLTVGGATRAATHRTRLERLTPVEAGDETPDPDATGTAIGTTLLPAQADEAPAAAERSILTAEIADLLTILDDGSRRLVAERFGLDGQHPRGVLAQAAERGVSREAVRRRFARAMDRLADEAHRRHLESWLVE